MHYTRQVSIIEIDVQFISIAQTLTSKVSSLVTVSSNVAQCADIAKYPGINIYMIIHLLY